MLILMHLFFTFIISLFLKVIVINTLRLYNYVSSETFTWRQPENSATVYFVEKVFN